MSSFNVWNQVKVTNEQHPRNGQAGVVHAISAKNTDQVQVKFDIDDTVESVNVADLTDLRAQ